MTWLTKGPLLRCPFCRHWVKPVTRGEWKLKKPTKQELDMLGRNQYDGQQTVDSPASDRELSRAYVREEAQE